jgi:hypothetical protein
MTTAANANSNGTMYLTIQATTPVVLTVGSAART